jgi:GNAT superfamily N-acetyltransferase
VARRDAALVGLGSAARVAASTWEIGLLVEDAWQRRGVGGQLLAELVGLSRRAGAGVIRAEVLEQDAAMLGPLRAFGPLTARRSHGVVTAEVRLWA